jgi:hypothetical protein
MATTMDIYTSSSSMDHGISSLLILASCMSAYNQLPSSTKSTLSYASLLSSAIYNWLSLSNKVHTSVLLSSTKCHKSFSYFVLIVDFFLFLLLLSLFMIDSDFGLSCNIFHMIWLMYFILSCVLSDLYNDSDPYLVVLP